MIHRRRRPLAVLAMLAAGACIAAPAMAAPAAEARIQSVTVQPGDTLEGLLVSAGLAPDLRREALLGLAAEFDPETLQPGNRLELDWAPDGRRLRRVTLDLSDGTRIEIIFGPTVSANRIEAEGEVRERRVQIVIGGALYDALAEAGAPPQLAVEMAGMLSGVVDFRREIRKGDRVAVAWQERLPLVEGRPAAERLRYARLELSGRLIEVLRRNGDDGFAILEDGVPMPRYVKPVSDARLSSTFGRRLHPVHGVVRQHAGVDWTAPRGTPVRAAGTGRVAFVGRMRGYGRVIDLAHGSGVVTRYAHLSSVAEGLDRGDRIAAGDVIGGIGSTGTATGPNLHYEVRLEGRAVDPLAPPVPVLAAEPAQPDAAALAAYRSAFGHGEALVSSERSSTSEGT